MHLAQPRAASTIPWGLAGPLRPHTEGQRGHPVSCEVSWVLGRSSAILPTKGRGVRHQGLAVHSYVSQLLCSLG